MVKAEDMGEFYRVPADNRDLNYSKYSMDVGLPMRRIRVCTKHVFAGMVQPYLKTITALTLYCVHAIHVTLEENSCLDA